MLRDQKRIGIETWHFREINGWKERYTRKNGEIFLRTIFIFLSLILLINILEVHSFLPNFTLSLVATFLELEVFLWREGRIVTTLCFFVDLDLFNDLESISIGRKPNQFP